MHSLKAFAKNAFRALVPAQGVSLLGVRGTLHQKTGRRWLMAWMDCPNDKQLLPAPSVV